MGRLWTNASPFTQPAHAINLIASWGTPAAGTAGSTNTILIPSDILQQASSPSSSHTNSFDAEKRPEITQKTIQFDACLNHIQAVSSTRMNTSPAWQSKSCTMVVVVVEDSILQPEPSTRAQQYGWTVKKPLVITLDAWYIGWSTSLVDL